MNTRSATLVCLIYAALALTATRAIIFAPGTIGLNWDWVIPPYPEQLRLFLNDLRWGWSEGSFGVEGFFQSYWYILLAFAIGAMGFGGDVLSKLLLFALLCGSGVSMYFLLRTIGFRQLACFFAGLFYMFNPFTFLRLVAGHLLELFAVTAAPVALAYYLKSLRSVEHRKWISNNLACIVATSVTFVAPLQIGPVVLMMIVYGLADQVISRRISYRKIATMLIVPLVSVMTHPGMLYALADYALKVQVGTSPSFASKGAIGWISYRSDVLRALTLGGWVGAGFEGIPFWSIPALLFSLAGISAIWLSWRRHAVHVLTWGVLSLSFVIIVTGTSTPLGSLFWNLAYTHFTPFFAFYVDAYHLMFIPAIGLPVLFSAFLDTWPTISKLNKKRIWRRSGVLIIGILLVAYAWPSLDRSYGDSFQTYVWNPAYHDLYQKLSAEHGNQRMLWLPTIAYAMMYEGAKLGGLDPMIAHPPIPAFPQFGLGAQLSANRQAAAVYGNLIIDSVSPYTDRELPTNYKTKYVGQLLAYSGIKYIALRDDAWTTTRFGLQNNVSRNILGNSSDLTRAWEVGPISLYENKVVLPLLYLASTDEASFLVGTESALISLSYLTQETAVLPPQKLIVWAQNLPNQELSRHLEVPRTVVVASEGFRDLLFSFLPERYHVDLQQFVEGSFDWFRTSTGVWSIPYGEGLPTMNLTFTPPKAGLYQVWMKAANGSELIRLKIGDRFVTDVATKGMGGEHPSRYWLHLGDVRLDAETQRMTLAGQGYSYVDQLILAPSQAIEESTSAVLKLTSSKRLVTLIEPEVARTPGLGWKVAPLGSNSSGGWALVSTKNSTSTTYEFFSPRSGEHEIWLRVAGEGTLNITLESSGSQTIPVRSRAYEWRSFPLKVAAAGWQELRLTGDGNLLVDLIAVTHPTGLVASAHELKYKKVNPTFLLAEVKSTEPSFLVLSYNWSPYWVASGDGRRLESISANGFAQAFVLKDQGAVKIEYTRQGTFLETILVSATVLTIVIVGSVILRISPRRKYVAL